MTFLHVFACGTMDTDGTERGTNQFHHSYSLKKEPQKKRKEKKRKREKTEKENTQVGRTKRKKKKKFPELSGRCHLCQYC